MTDIIPEIIWQNEDWVVSAHQWIHDALSRQNITCNGAIESIHEQPWSTILRVPTAQGNLFFKASSPDSVQEVALMQMLTQFAPHCTPQLVALDRDRGWMIMRDGGPRLRETLQTTKDIHHWETLLPVYADLQIEATQHADDLLAAGIVQRTLAQFPALYQQILADCEVLRIDQPEGVSSSSYQRMQDLSAAFTEKCAVLAAYNIPMSLHHGDLHDGNIFYDGSTYRFFDWGDANLSHPFFSLRTSYVSAEMRFELEEDTPILNRLRDAYLVPWQSFETQERLLEAFALAKQLWAFSSMLGWYSTLSPYRGNPPQNLAHIMGSLVEEFLAYFDKR